MTDELPANDNVIRLLDHGELEDVADYVRRGRALKAQSPDQLEQTWVAAFTLWATHQTGKNRQAVNDIRAEMSLRGGTPPYQRVRTSLERLGDEEAESIREKIKAWLQTWNEEPVEKPEHRGEHTSGGDRHE